jgi:hypothetical protein
VQLMNIYTTILLIVAKDISLQLALYLILKKTKSFSLRRETYITDSCKREKASDNLVLKGSSGFSVYIKFCQDAIVVYKFKTKLYATSALQQKLYINPEL